METSRRLPRDSAKVSNSILKTILTLKDLMWQMIQAHVCLTTSFLYLIFNVKITLYNIAHKNHKFMYTCALDVFL